MRMLEVEAPTHTLTFSLRALQTPALKKKPAEVSVSPLFLQFALLCMLLS
jgi:hypothetical protein